MTSDFTQETKTCTNTKLLGVFMYVLDKHDHYAFYTWVRLRSCTVHLYVIVCFYMCVILCVSVCVFVWVSMCVISCVYVCVIIMKLTHIHEGTRIHIRSIVQFCKYVSMQAYRQTCSSAQACDLRDEHSNDFTHTRSKTRTCRYSRAIHIYVQHK